MESSMMFQSNYLPAEILLIVADMLSPIDLYNYMMISRRHFDLVMSNINHFVHLYARTSKFPVERFMWSQYDNPLLNKYDNPDSIKFLIMIYILQKLFLIHH